ncbi:MAG: hypothetical protein ACLPN1_10960 [Dissulfurispiraceae bacterium]
MARQGAFKSEKRKKELNRLKKQEEKRQKRIKKSASDQPDGNIIDTEGSEAIIEGVEEPVKE